MARIPDAELERLKQEVSLARLLEGQGHQLVSQGKDLACRCPWHEGDDTPSCIVTPKTNLWHCFGCNAGGTVIDWVMRSHRVSFRHACELLLKEHPALAADVLPTSTGAPRKLSAGRLRQAQSFSLAAADQTRGDQVLLDQVIDYYHATLKTSPEALKYLDGRGLGNSELIERFRLGYANRTLAYRLAPKAYKAGAELRTALQRVGILRDSGHEHFNGSIVVPLWAAPSNGAAPGSLADGGPGPADSLHVVGAYARKIHDNLRAGTPKHLYLPGPHRAAGSKTSVTDSLGNPLYSASYNYGIGAFMYQSTDADLGPWTYTFDALGELVVWTDAKGQSFTASYDALSRMLTRSEPDLFSQWTWGTSAAAHEIGQLHSVCTGTGTNPTNCTASPGYSESETYDNYGRAYQRTIQIPGDASYTYTLAYNVTTGLLDTLQYPSVYGGYALKLQYAYQNGILKSVTDVSDSPNVAFWTADATNPAGQVTQEAFGNGVVVTHSFDAVTAWPSSITAGVGGGAALQNNSYLWDNVGNLTQRQDNNAGVTENVYPDSLNRLSNTVGDTNTSLTYDTMGRLASWTAYGGTPPNTNDYATPQSGCSYYANAQPHAVRQVEFDPSQPNDYSSYCYDKNGNLVSILVKWPATYSWTSYNQPSSLSGLGNSSQFFYDHNHQRWKQIASYGGSTETTEYIGSLLEKMTNSSGTAYRYYVSAGNNFIVYNRWASGNNVVYYVTRDHLGSSAVITDPNGALVVSEKFAALGWNENTSAQEATIASVTRHGFTGQEGLDNIGMVNMNGRIYVPSGSRLFLSPDPYIQDPTSTLSYNRYAYVNYNPLSYEDPTGFDYTRVQEDAGSTGLPEVLIQGTRDWGSGFDLGNALADAIAASGGLAGSDPKETVTVAGTKPKPPKATVNLALQQIPCLLGVGCYVAPQGNLETVTVRASRTIWNKMTNWLCQDGSDGSTLDQVADAGTGADNTANMVKAGALAAAASRANSVPQATELLGTQAAGGLSIVGRVGTGAALFSIAGNAFAGNVQGAMYGAIDLGVYNGLAALGEASAIPTLGTGTGLSLMTGVAYYTAGGSQGLVQSSLCGN